MNPEELKYRVQEDGLRVQLPYCKCGMILGIHNTSKDYDDKLRLDYVCSCGAHGSIGFGDCQDKLQMRSNKLSAIRQDYYMRGPWICRGCDTRYKFTSISRRTPNIVRVRCNCQESHITLTRSL